MRFKDAINHILTRDVADLVASDRPIIGTHGITSSKTPDIIVFAEGAQSFNYYSISLHRILSQSEAKGFGWRTDDNWSLVEIPDTMRDNLMIRMVHRS